MQCFVPSAGARRAARYDIRSQDCVGGLGPVGFHSAGVARRASQNLIRQVSSKCDSPEDTRDAVGSSTDYPAIVLRPRAFGAGR